MKNIKLLVSVICFLASPAFADGPTFLPLPDGSTVKVSDLPRNSCLMTMMKEIKPILDTNATQSFKVADKATIIKLAQNSFDPSVYKKVVALFKDGEAGFEKLLDALAGQQVDPESIPGAIGKIMQDQNLIADSSKIGLSAVSTAPLISLTSRSGTVVVLDSKNAFYNIGYKPGGGTAQNMATASKSGRSFGASPGHNALDASDLYLLGEMSTLLTSKADSMPVYEAFLAYLTKTDTSKYSSLSTAQQTVLTDLIAVYTAELDRNLMNNLKAHPWENDLAETFLLSAYGTQAGKVMKEGKLITGTPKDYFGVGKSGSGIGETRADRELLQKKVSDAARALDPATINTIEAITGKASNGDVIHQIMVYLNDPQKQTDVVKNADKLNTAVVDFLKLISTKSAEITQKIGA